MIRSNCQFVSDIRCGKMIRARRIHKYCREHHLLVNGTRRAVPHQIKKTRIIKTKPVKIEPTKKNKKKN